MDCRAVREELVAFLDNEVPSGLRAEIEAHLKGCPDCAREMRALASTWERIGQGPVPPPLRPDFTASVMDSIRPEAGPAVPPDGPPAARKPRGPVIVVTGVFLLAAVGVALLVWEHPAEKAGERSPGYSAEPAQAPADGSPAPAAPLGRAADDLKPVKPPAAVPVLPAPVPVKTPAVLPPVPPAGKVPVLPVAALSEADREIVADLEMFENTDILKDLDLVSDMEMLDSIKEPS